MTKSIFHFMVIAFLLNIKLVSAQNAACTVKWGPEIEAQRGENISGWIGEDEDYYYLSSLKFAMFKKSGLSIKKIDHKLNQVATAFVEQEYKEAGEEFYTERVDFLNEKLILFSSVTDKKNKEYILYWKWIDSKTLAPLGTFKKLFSTPYDKNSSANQYSFNTSPDEQRILVGITIPGREKDDRDNQYVYMYNENMELQWKKLITNDNPNLNLGYYYRLDDKGNIYNLSRNYTEKNGWFSKEVVSYSYNIIAFTENGEKKISYVLDVPRKFITDISYKIDSASSKIIVAGFYTNDRKNYGFDGCFYQQLDIKTKEVLVSSVKDFDISILTVGMTEKEAERARRRDNRGKDLNFASYDLDKLVLRNDGGAVMICEQYYVIAHTTTNSNGGTSTYYTYHYNNLLIVNITAKGNIEWVSAIPKAAHEREPGRYTSYVSMVKGDKIYLLFNDNLKNYGRDIKKDGVLEAEFTGKNGIMTMATVSADGSVKREKLFETANISVVPRPVVSNQINDDEILLIGDYKKTDQFAIIKFK